MLSTLIKTPARTAAGTVRLFYRPGVWLVRTIAGVALKPLHPEQPTETTPAPRSGQPPSGRESSSSSPPARESASTGEPQTARRSPSGAKPQTARRSPSGGKPQTARRSPSGGEPQTTRRSPSGGKPQTARRSRSAATPRTRETSVTLPAADPEHPGIPGRDAPPALPSEPHHMLNTPVGEPDPTEWPDPYDRRPDPRNPNPDDPLPLGDDAHPPTGAQSTSEPHPDQDPEAIPPTDRDRDALDD